MDKRQFIVGGAAVLLASVGSVASDFVNAAAPAIVYGTETDPDGTVWHLATFKVEGGYRRVYATDHATAREYAELDLDMRYTDLDLRDLRALRALKGLTP